MVFKIRILKTIIESFKLAWTEKHEIVKLFWLSFIAYVLIDCFFMYYSDVIGLPIQTDFSIVNTFVNRLIKFSIEAVFTFGCIFALYRYLILDKCEQYRIIKYTRGITNSHTVFIFPWYFRFGKPEILASCLFLVISIFYAVVRDGLFYYLYNRIGGFSINLIVSSLIIAKYLLFALVALVWAKIALEGKLSGNILLKAISQIKGNIIRVAVCFGLIALPFLIIEQLHILMMLEFGDAVQLSTVFGHITRIIFMFLYFCKTAVEVALLSMVYKKLAVD